VGELRKIEKFGIGRLVSVQTLNQKDESKCNVEQRIEKCMIIVTSLSQITEE
jgi:hypothetical protein